MQRTQKAVSGGIFLQENNMSGLLPSKAGADFLHSFQNITIPHLGLLYPYTVFLSHQEKSKVTHNRCHNGIIGKLTLTLHMIAHNRHDLIAVYYFPILVNRHQPVGVAVKSQADIRVFIDHPRL